MKDDKKKSWSGSWGKEITAKSTTSPRDFFLWAGTLIALYGSVTAFLTLAFSYISYAFPDALSYAYSNGTYSGQVKVSMAVLIVLAPLTILLLSLIRQTITEDEGKANIWARRWAIVFTLFMTVAIAAIDLITLISTFLGGELTARFLLKVTIILLVAAFFFMHFLADLKNYWLSYPGKAKMAGIASLVLACITILAGFAIFGSPAHARLMSYDQEKVQDLQSIQSQVVQYYQSKQTLPTSLAVLNDSLTGYSVPQDPQLHINFSYQVTRPTAFILCATFNFPSDDQNQSMTMPQYPGARGNDSWTHGYGKSCFLRTIDPAQYPPLNVKPL